MAITKGKDDVLMQPCLRLLDDAKMIRAAFLGWHNTLRAGAVSDGDSWCLPEEGISFRRLASRSAHLRIEFWVGQSNDAAVQINEPKTPESENPLSGIGVGPDGRSYLLRQGDLRKNKASGAIRGEAFAKRTGLPLVSVVVANQQAKRAWHVVCPLSDVRPESVKSATGDFVNRCWTARNWNPKVEADSRRLTRLFGSGETGGWSVVTPDPAPREILRAHGEVWKELARVLKIFQIKVRKPRHAAGYEVDAEILGENQLLLVEIKTSTMPADVYAGIGQLAVYPILIPDLAAHARILLLPERRPNELADALKECGVELHRFRIKVQRRCVEVRFSSDFLTRCGVPAEGVEKFGF